ncbi:acetate kinase [Calothrix sp. 336/3]|uniref:acetate kinase n=1 Tax=Calothrix sp. 336/3 TaxID=1337936 RepID=UPI0004E46DAC|nr:acetate kinase [Calothrix sp. 336/3]AKG23873.1 acetate kinase [Calothrix sp. 336/3]
MKILVLNAGSSSQKSCLYNLDNVLPPEPPTPLWEAQIDWTHHQGVAEIHVKTIYGDFLKQELNSVSHREATTEMLKTLWQGVTKVIQQPQDIDIVGHRVVHGGEEYSASTRITPEVKAVISRLATLAPAHNPANLEGIEAIEEILGDKIPQVAVFDTAFHTQMPLAAAVYPLPYEFLTQGIRRYGFHGISHQYCSQKAAAILGRELTDLRLITCHLGNGCSLAAIRDGHSVDTTMGFTPLDGLMMGSRSGAVDPGILIYLLREKGYSIEELDQLLNKSSGLKGVSGISEDMRQLNIAIADGNHRAQLAIDIYIHRLCSGIGAMLANLGRLDALIFTAGVGENAANIRERVCESLTFLDLKIDKEKNNIPHITGDIATVDSAARILVIHTQEDWAIAQECWHLL